MHSKPMKCLVFGKKYAYKMATVIVFRQTGKKPDPKGRSVLNQLFLMISGAFHMKSTMLFMKSTTFHEKHRFSKWNVPLFMKSAAFHFEKCRISLWAFRLSPSIGLSYERPTIKQHKAQQLTLLQLPPISSQTDALLLGTILLAS